MFQILTNVPQEHTAVMQMLSVLIPMGHIPALASLGIVEMGRHVKVRVFFCSPYSREPGSTVGRQKPVVLNPILVRDRFYHCSKLPKKSKSSEVNCLIRLSN